MWVAGPAGQYEIQCNTEQMGMSSLHLCIGRRMLATADWPVSLCVIGGGPTSKEKDFHQCLAAVRLEKEHVAERSVRAIVHPHRPFHLTSCYYVASLHVRVVLVPVKDAKPILGS